MVLSQTHAVATVQDWLKLSAAAERMAYLAAAEPITRAQAWPQAGYSCECLLKAIIMQTERLNTWPSFDKTLHIHDLAALADRAGVTVTVADEIAPAWKLVLDWRRSHMYYVGDPPEPIVRDLINSVLGKEGVNAWLSDRYLQAT